MKRRDVLKIGAVATAVTQLPLETGCIVPRATTPSTDAEGGKAFLAKLDGQLAALEGSDFVSRFTRKQLGRDPTGTQQAMLDEKDAMFRRMLRTLLITQGFRDQEPATQLDPDVQARMFMHMDEIGSTVFEVSDMLGSLDQPQRAKLRQKLKAKPDLPMAIAEAIDAQASHAGVSAGRRMQLRQMMANATFRLRHGDPNTLIDEYVAKVERVKQNGTTDAQALDLAQKMGERAFWKYQHHLAQDGGQQPATPATPAPAPVPLPASDGMIEPAPAQPPPPPPPNKQVMPPSATPVQAPKPVKWDGGPRPGTGAMHAAGYMMGIGVVTFGVSAALVNSSDAFLFGLTVGAVLFAVGLVTLLVGVSLYVSAD